MIKDDNYIHICGWMLNVLHLKGNELLIYALIHGFSQDGKSTFSGSMSYVAEWTNSTRQGVAKALSSLTEKKLVIKTVRTVNRERKCEYFTAKSRENAVHAHTASPPQEEGTVLSRAEYGTDGQPGLYSLPTERAQGCQLSLHPPPTEFARGCQPSLHPPSTEFARDGKLSLHNNTEDMQHTAACEIIGGGREAEDGGQKKRELVARDALKSLFGGRDPFDNGFAGAVAQMTDRFGLREDDIRPYLRFVYGRTQEKKPRSLTNLFYRLAQSASMAQDFLSSEKSRDEEKSRLRYCYVCTTAFTGTECPECGFPAGRPFNEDEIIKAREAFRHRNGAAFPAWSRFPPQKSEGGP